MRAGVYVPFTAQPGHGRRSLMAPAAMSRRSKTSEPSMDLVYIAAGVLIFGVFALYAVLLKRI
jgi:hypothetical protein